MKIMLYEVTGKSGANLRELPSTDSKVVETLKTGAEVEVVQKITATNTNGTDTVYFLCKRSGKYLWAAARVCEFRRIAHKKTIDKKPKSQGGSAYGRRLYHSPRA